MRCKPAPRFRRDDEAPAVHGCLHSEDGKRRIALLGLDYANGCGHTPAAGCFLSHHPTHYRHAGVHVIGEVGQDAAEIGKPALGCDRSTVFHWPSRGEHPHRDVEGQPVRRFLSLDSELDLYG